jgi:hypothetical protein
MELEKLLIVQISGSSVGGDLGCVLVTVVNNVQGEGVALDAGCAQMAVGWLRNLWQCLALMVL